MYIPIISPIISPIIYLGVELLMGLGACILIYAADCLTIRFLLGIKKHIIVLVLGAILTAITLIAAGNLFWGLVLGGIYALILYFGTLIAS